MPSPADIVLSLGEIARARPWLAAWWHLYFALWVIALMSGFRPSRRLFGLVMVPPLLSVSALAWMGSSPFNGTLFALVAIVLAIVAARLRGGRVWLSPLPLLLAGGLLFAFGWLYPHFTSADSIVAYLYATPLGLIPCPTLSAIVGLTLIWRGLGSVAWSSVVGLAGIFYGSYGAAVLGVSIDWGLAAGSICALLMPFILRSDRNSAA